MLQIDNFLKNNNFSEAINICDQFQMDNLSLILQQLSGITKPENKNIKVMLLCNWCSSEALMNQWNKMSKKNGRWNDIQLVLTNPDFWVIINAPPDNVQFDKKRTLVFRMEPCMAKRPQLWKEWADTPSKDFLRVFKHETGDYNNCEWHLSKTYNELLLYSPVKTRVLSTVLSGKYGDIGQIKRVDFVKFLDSKNLEIDVFGDNKWEYKNFKNPLPYHKKDDAIFPYKYTFNCENNSIYNYFTEKLIDGILGECLTFYWGCPNIPEYIDPRAYVQLGLSNFEKDYELITTAIKEDWYTQRLPFIKEAKIKILNELQFFPRLEKILSDFNSTHTSD